MIKKITASDRKRNPSVTKGKVDKLVSVSNGRILGYGDMEDLKRRER